MNKVFGIIALALVAFASAAVPNNGTELQLGSAAIGSLPIVLDPTTPYGLPQLYFVYLPINTKNITISFTQDPSCYSLNVYAATETYPCGYNYPFDSSSPYFYCYTASDTLYSSGNFQQSYFAGDYDGSLGSLEFQVVQGGYLYFAVNRYYSSDANKVCPYTIRVDADFCPSGQIAIGDGYDGAVCNTYTNVTTGSFTGSFTKGGDYYDTVYRLVLPDYIGNVHIQASANDSFTVYGLNRQVIRNSYFSGGCYDYGYSNDNADVVCTNIEPGNFYVYIYSSSPISGSINITTTVCSPTGSLGPYCNETNINVASLFTTGSVNFTNAAYESSYGCVDLSTVSQFINSYYFVAAVANSSSPDLSYGRGGFPGYYYPSVSFTTGSSSLSSYSVVISPIDTFGPFYSNVFCFYLEYSSSAVSGQLVVNGTGAVSTTGASASTTGMMSTTGSVVMTSGMRATTAAPAVTTAQRMTTAAPAVTTALRMTTAVAAATSTASAASTSGALAMIPAFLVAIVAMMF